MTKRASGSKRVCKGPCLEWTGALRSDGYGMKWFDGRTQRENILRGESACAMHARKTHCINGHEFTPENTYRRPDNGGRCCRTCVRERKAAGV